MPKDVFDKIPRLLTLQKDEKEQHTRFVAFSVSCKRRFAAFKFKIEDVAMNAYLHGRGSVYHHGLGIHSPLHTDRHS